MDRDARMIVKAETKPYIEAFRGRARTGEPTWLATKREAALANFGEKGFPTRGQEAWRFTNLRALERAAFLPGEAGAPSAAIEGYRLAGRAHRLVFVRSLSHAKSQSSEILRSSQLP